ncbi:D-amino acid dehydrogenase [Magnetovibrio sp.]|uniref:D-amino acid dehydrogenase n=1 Tax=Magnetovibrio sp. TaxID=2024836 RepID=UPI002F951FF8
MKVVVLGAGVIGVTSAYELACDGHEVIVVEQREGVALETSFANGGQLSADHGEPLAAPGVIEKAIKWLGKYDAPLLYRLRLDPALWSWTLRFLSNSSGPKFWRNAARVLRLTLYSRQRMAETLKRETIAFDHLSTGIVSIYQDAREFDRSLEDARTMKELGAERRSLDRRGCIELEPALAHSTLLIAGGIFTPLDESGDCFEFTKSLAERCTKRGVDFRFNTTVKGFNREGWRITSVETDRGTITGDVFVMALGSYSPLLLKGLDLKLPIYPAKGYSVTMPVIDDAMAPKCSVTSQSHKLVFSRLGNKLRVAGMLEFNGYDTHLDDRRANIVLKNAVQVFPRAVEEDHAVLWTGLRPMTPDGSPVLGRAKQENLILNTGHGMLGWTMAMGSARITADLVAGHAPHIDMDGLGWERFS